MIRPKQDFSVDLEVRYHQHQCTPHTESEPPFSTSVNTYDSFDCKLIRQGCLFQDARAMPGISESLLNLGGSSNDSKPILKVDHGLRAALDDPRANWSNPNPTISARTKAKVRAIRNSQWISARSGVGEFCARMRRTGAVGFRPPPQLIVLTVHGILHVPYAPACEKSGGLELHSTQKKLPKDRCNCLIPGALPAVKNEQSEVAVVCC